MINENKQTIAKRELYLQRLKWRHEDNLETITIDMMIKRLESDGYGGIKVIDTPSAKDYRNTLRQIASVETLCVAYR